MDLFITLLIVLLLIFWPRLGKMRYYILLFVGVAFLFFALIFAPLILLTPVFYAGAIIIILLILYREIVNKRKND